MKPEILTDFCSEVLPDVKADLSMMKIYVNDKITHLTLDRLIAQIEAFQLEVALSHHPEQHLKDKLDKTLQRINDYLEEIRCVFIEENKQEKKDGAA